MTDLEKKEQSETQQPSGQIEPLKLKTVNGFRTRFGTILKKIGKIVAPAVLVAHLGGAVVQDKFRDSVNYNPDKPIPTASNSGNKKKEKHGETIGIQPSTVGDRESTQKSVKKNPWQKAKEALKKAKEWSKNKIDNMKDRSKLIKRYRETKQEMKNAYNSLLKAVDKGVYWGPFMILFLATMLLTNKILRTKKNLTETVDPQVEKNMQDLEMKVNELVDAINNNQYPTLDEIRVLMEEFEKNTADIDKEKKPVAN